jgi:hypothetical protein
MGLQAVALNIKSATLSIIDDFCEKKIKFRAKMEVDLLFYTKLSIFVV